MLSKLRLVILGENADGITTAITVGPDMLRRAIFEVELDGVAEVHHLHGDVKATAISEEDLEEMLSSIDGGVDAIKAGAAEVALARFGHDVAVKLVQHGIVEEGTTYDRCVQLLEEALDRTPKPVAAHPVPQHTHVHEGSPSEAGKSPEPIAPTVQSATAGIDEPVKA